MSPKLEFNISLKKKQEIELELPDYVFPPSFMTNEILNSLSMNFAHDRDLKILDLATGPGTIALNLKSIGYRNIYVSDTLEKTLEVAQNNFKKNKFKPKGIFLSDLFEGIDEKFDLIITNPPAYPENHILKLNDGIDVSVFSGNDGRKFVRRFFENVDRYLTKEGKFLITIPSFLDWDFISDLLRKNQFEYRENISEKCQLPTYGYPADSFRENFTTVFSNDFYKDGNRNKNHYWINVATNAVEFKVKSIIGHKKR